MHSGVNEFNDENANDARRIYTQFNRLANSNIDKSIRIVVPCCVPRIKLNCVVEYFISFHQSMLRVSAHQRTYSMMEQ